MNALAAGGTFVGAFALAAPVDAQPRTVKVTLLGGAVITVTVDVPPGTPLDQIKIPGIRPTHPIVAIEDSGPAATPTPAPPAPAPAAPAPAAAPERSRGLPDAPRTQRADKQRRGQRQPTVRRGQGRADALAVVEQLAGAVAKRDEAKRREQREAVQMAGRSLGGAPTNDNPGFSLAIPGAAPIGVPNFMIDKFRIPPFLLPIYQAAGIEYGIRWEVLAAINEIETDYGRNLNVSSAGALGWMQFIPSTWKSYGVDANRDGKKDPYNPVDAIFAAARYLKAAGADKDLEKAIFAYNHADWYVDSVVLRARLIGGLPADLVGSLTGLTQAYFPVRAKATYADDLADARLVRRTRRGKNPAFLIDSQRGRRSISIYSRAGAPVVAVNDGRIVRVGRSARLGRFLQLQDTYGNTFTYAHLSKVARTFLAPRDRRVSRAAVRRELDLPAPRVAATAGRPTRRSAAGAGPTSERRAEKRRGSVASAAAPSAGIWPPSRPSGGRQDGQIARLPMWPPSRPPHGGGGGQIDPLARGTTTFAPFTHGLPVRRSHAVERRLRKGSRVVAGTLLGRIGRTSPRVAPHLLFEIRPAGRGAPRIDPKPILDGWKLLENTALYRARGANALTGGAPTIGQIMLLSKEQLQRRVLANPRIDVYDCGRSDIRAGVIDRRALATLEFLAASGLKPTVTSLRCGHGYYTASGNVSHHSSGNAIDIAAINGIPIIGHQGPGSITELAVQRLLTLQGTMKPDQIITLMKFAGADNTFAMGDHADHIHVGWRPLFGTNGKLAKQVNAILKPDQWIKLVDRLTEIDNPTVRRTPSKAALDTKRASEAHASD